MEVRKVDFGERLRSMRAEHGYSLEYIAERVGVTRQTLSRYETGVIKNIPAEAMEKIATVMGTTPAELMGWQDEERTAAEQEFTPDERLFMRRYRMAAPDDKLIVDTVLHKYAPAEEPPRAAELIRLYREPYAAGMANPVEGEDYELIELPRGMRADCAVRIQGDSMEPYIHDGGFVYVRQNETLRDGDVGIFYVTGMGAVCKQYCCDNYGNVYLFSLNRERADADVTVMASSGMTVYVQGRVVMPQRVPLP